MYSKTTTRREPAAKQRPCIATALRLLGRRALTDSALQSLLAEEGYAQEDVAAAMTQVRTWGYINDDRLGESVVAAAVRRKKGPAWLRQQMAQREVPHDVAARCLHALSDDALALATDVVASRFDAAKLADPRTAVRAMRLLQRRGFDLSTCRAAIKSVGATGSNQKVVTSRLLGQEPWTSDALDDD